MSHPLRIQLRRTAGSRLPPNTTKVDRTTRWGNPWRAWKNGNDWTISKHGHRNLMASPNTQAAALAMAVDLHRVDIEEASAQAGRLGIRFPTADDIRHALRGVNLACWCRLCERHADGRPWNEACADCAPCHGDTLLTIANAPVCEEVRAAEKAASRARDMQDIANGTSAAEVAHRNDFFGALDLSGVRLVSVGSRPVGKPTSLRVLVCGSRSFGIWGDGISEETANLQIAFLRSTLDRLHFDRNISCIIHGDSNGADRLAGDWARDRNIPEIPFPTDWGTHGRAAGPIRNARMLAEGKPDLVIVFPGGRGTQDMIDRASRAGLPITFANPEGTP